jgi:glycosyltransferase involved in cell wall biosynthesis
VSTVSARVIARNEEAVIGRCLDSLQGVVDEIVLVHDGPCEDRTLEIAERAGARVFVRDRVGHSEAQSVFAYEQARGEWLLRIDADEFLSPQLREAIPDLARREDVNGYEFLWPIWDGQRYVTERGPFRLALFRRSATHVLGMIHSVERVDGRVERLPLLLEHRPRYDNFTLRSIRTKWRRWAWIHSGELITPLDQLPRFNWDGPSRWPWWRGVLNRLSPILLVPYTLASFARFVAKDWDALPLRDNLRMAAYQSVYAFMVQFYVAKRLYWSRRR